MNQKLDCYALILKHLDIHLRRKLTAGYLPPPNIGIFDPTNMWISSNVHKMFRTKSFLRPFQFEKKKGIWIFFKQEKYATRPTDLLQESKMQKSK